MNLTAGHIPDAMIVCLQPGIQGLRLNLPNEDNLYVHDKHMTPLIFLPLFENSQGWQQ